MTSAPPITIIAVGRGQVLVRGAPRRAFDLLAVDREWDSVRAGWLLPALAVDVVLDWAGAHGRAVEVNR
jgi:hypothetical protein